MVLDFGGYASRLRSTMSLINELQKKLKLRLPVEFEFECENEGILNAAATIIKAGSRDPHEMSS